MFRKIILLFAILSVATLSQGRKAHRLREVMGVEEAKDLIMGLHYGFFGKDLKSLQECPFQTLDSVQLFTDGFECIRDLTLPRINVGLGKILEAISVFVIEIELVCPGAKDAVKSLKDKIFLVARPGKLPILIAKNFVSNGPALLFEVSLINNAVKRGDYYKTGLHIGKVLDILLSEK